MEFKGKRGEKNRQNLIESLRELTRPEVSDFRFDCMDWDGDNPILKLKGNEETPDFTVTLGSPDDDFVVIVLPDDHPEFSMHSNTVCRRVKRLAQEIWLCCISIMIEKMGMYCYFGQHDGVEGWLKIIPPDQVKFIPSDRSNPFTIELDTASRVRILPYTGKPLEDYGHWDPPGIVEIRTGCNKDRFIVYQAEHFGITITEMVYGLSPKTPESFVAA